MRHFRPSNAPAAGFSILELMIVVAIVAMAAYFFVPKYGVYQARLRQQEAKLWLANLYVAERNFAAEHCSYTACLPRIGVFPGDDTTYTSDIAPHYARGFRNAEATGTDCGPPAGTFTCSTAANNNQACSNYAFVSNANAAATDCDVAMGASVTGQEAQNSFGNFYTARARENPSAAWPNDTNFNATSISATAFIAGAVGSILSTTGALDHWTIDQNNNVVNTFSGLN